MPVSSAPSPHVIPVEQVAKLSRWGRVALVARASMRTVPWFVPGPMRARQLALADLLAIDVCSTLGMLAATGGRQLATAVAEAAANAAMAALAAPGRVPLLPTDQAAMLAGLTVEWAGASVPPDALDTGSVRSRVEGVGRHRRAGPFHGESREHRRLIGGEQRHATGRCQRGHRGIRGGFRHGRRELTPTGGRQHS